MPQAGMGEYPTPLWMLPFITVGVVWGFLMLLRVAHWLAARDLELGDAFRKVRRWLVRGSA